MPEISVIIPTFNRETFIGDAIDSALNQTFLDLEIIVVDDGSTDNTRKIVAAYKDPRIKYVYIDNSGLAAARNKGITESRGSYLTFLDSDDILYKNALDVLYENIKKRKVMMLYSNCCLAGEEKNIPFGLKFKKKHYEGKIFETLLLKGNFISCLGILIDRRVVDTVGCFDPNFRRLEDWEYFLRIAKKHEIGYVDETLSEYRFHGGNMTDDYESQNMAKIKVIRTIDEKIGIENKIKRRALGRVLFSLGRIYLIQKDKRAKSVIFEGLKESPFSGTGYWLFVISLFNKDAAYILINATESVYTLLFSILGRHRKVAPPVNGGK